MKVAILFAGRIKGYENVKANLKNIQDTYKATVFCSLNNKVKSNYIKGFCDTLNITDDRLHLERIIGNIVSIVNQVPTPDVSTFTTMPDYIKTLQKDPKTPREGTYSMFYNIHKSFELLEKYQHANHMKFDCILFYRADIDSPELIHLKMPEKNRIYIPEGHDYNAENSNFFQSGINGLIAYGDYDVMKIYCNVVNNIKKICIEQGYTYHPESLVKKNLENSSLHIERFPYKYSLHPSRHQPNPEHNSHE